MVTAQRLRVGEAPKTLSMVADHDVHGVIDLGMPTLRTDDRSGTFEKKRVLRDVLSRSQLVELVVLLFGRPQMQRHTEPTPLAASALEVGAVLPERKEYSELRAVPDGFRHQGGVEDASEFRAVRGGVA